MTGMKQIVVVLGMHRSGTSVATQILQAMGVRLGENLIEGAADNPDGFYEDRRLVKIAADILVQLRRSLPLRTGVLPMPDGWWLSEDFNSHRMQMIDIVASELEKSSGSVWGFKDPRTLVLLPLWQTVFETLNVSPKTVLCLRHPGAVARSLRRRDEIPPQRGETIWNNYLVYGVLHYRARFDCIIEYERWFTKPLEQADHIAQRLGLRSPLEDPCLVQEIGGIVKPSYCHSAPGDAVGFMLPQTEAFYMSLQALSSDDTARERVLQIAEAYRFGQLSMKDWADQIDALVENSQRLYSEMAQKDKRLSATSSNTTILELEDKLRQHELVSARLESKVAKLESEVSCLESELANAERWHKAQVEVIERKLQGARRVLADIEKVFAAVDTLGSPSRGQVDLIKRRFFLVLDRVAERLGSLSRV
ncbi:MAG: hypothetical protein RIC04_14150 [Parvibaculum sp.]|uniref:sulfotransferase family protein n=1 Tax=Parvibaculum sp. TaxID=2024848 RepID=UPI0032ED7A44